MYFCDVQWGPRGLVILSKSFRGCSASEPGKFQSQNSKKSKSEPAADRKIWVSCINTKSDELEKTSLKLASQVRAWKMHWLGKNLAFPWLHLMSHFKTRHILILSEWLLISFSGWSIWLIVTDLVSARVFGCVEGCRILSKLRNPFFFFFWCVLLCFTSYLTDSDDTGNRYGSESHHLRTNEHASTIENRRRKSSPILPETIWCGVHDV